MDSQPVLFDIYYYRTDTPVDKLPEERIYEACGLPRKEAQARLAELRKFNRETMRLPYHFCIKWRGFAYLPKSESAKRYDESDTTEWETFETPDYSPEAELGHAPLPPEAFSRSMPRKVDQRQPPPVEEPEIESLEELREIENDLPFD